MRSVARALERPTRALVAVHLRVPGAGDRELLGLARELRRVTRDAGAKLLVNRRPDIALVADADGVHLPESGLPVEAVRSLAPRWLVGVSRHDREGLEAAAGADYAFLSPVHATPGKGAPLGPAGFDALAAQSPVPVIALGGMDAARLRELRHARGVAVIRAVLHADDPAAEMQAIDLALSDSR